MAANTLCKSCIRALRTSTRTELRQFAATQTQSPLRAFSTRSVQYQKPNGGTSASQTSAPGDASALQGFAQRMRAQKGLRATTEPYVAYGSTQELFKACAQGAEYTMPELKDGEAKKVTTKGEELGIGQGWWYTELNLLPTFNIWAQITFLHMYLLTVRLRMFPEEHAQYWHQNLLDHFFYAAEDRMATLHGIEARSVRNKYLKDLFVQWRGVLAAYDEGLIAGDAVLAAAVWRNVFGGREDADVVHVAQVVSWVKKSLRDLDAVQDGELAGGQVRFPDPALEKKLVVAQSKGVGEKLVDGAQAVV